MLPFFCSFFSIQIIFFSINMATEILTIVADDITNSGSLQLQWSYTDIPSGETRSILFDGSYHVGPLVNESRVSKRERIRDFDAKNPSYELEFDPDRAEDPKTKEANLLLNHPHIFVVGRDPHANFARRRYTATLKNASINSGFSEVVNVARIFKLFFSMNPLEWRDLAYSYQVNPKGLSPKEVANVLINASNGLILKNTSVFDSYLHRDDASKVQILVSKAIALGVVRKENERFMSSGRSLGLTPESAVSFVLSDYGFRASLEESVAKNDPDLIRYKQEVSELDLSVLSHQELAPVNNDEINTLKQTNAVLTQDNKDLIEQLKVTREQRDNYQQELDNLKTSSIPPVAKEQLPAVKEQGSAPASNVAKPGPAAAKNAPAPVKRSVRVG